MNDDLLINESSGNKIFENSKKKFNISYQYNLNENTPEIKYENPYGYNKIENEYLL
jgi:hypothetical protein